MILICENCKRQTRKFYKIKVYYQHTNLMGEVKRKIKIKEKLCRDCYKKRK